MMEGEGKLPFKVAWANTSDFLKECLSGRFLAFSRTTMSVPSSSSFLVLSSKLIGIAFDEVAGSLDMVVGRWREGGLGLSI